MRMSIVCLTGLMVAVMCSSQVSAASTLMGDWKLWEIHDGIAPDSSGNGMDGIVYGNPTVIPGVGASFDGVNDYIEIPNTSGWNFPNGFTIDVSFNTATPQPLPRRPARIQAPIW